jgi:hypothetical protein
VKRNGVALLLGGAAAFSILFLRYRRFVLDDAFITFRYARNLAELGQLTWNPGHDPVEGYTSFVWVLLHAGAIGLGLDPVVFAKATSLAASLATIGLLVAATRDLPLFARLALVSAVSASPALALLAAQGMETALAGTLLLASAILAARALSRRDARSFLGWYASAFTAALTRPDTLVFGAGCLLGIVLGLPRVGGSRRRLALCGLPFALLGGAYLAWRVDHFGHWMPNPFHVKHGEPSAAYLVSFLVRVLSPYAALALGVAARSRARDREGARPALLGTLFFLAYLPAVRPIQGELWRYAFPAFGPFLLVVAAWTKGAALPAWTRLPLAALFVAWPLQHLPRADWEARRATPVDRILMGRALAGLEASMYTTESGALAYYSDWTVEDHLGLNSDRLARGEISRRAALEELAPDVVALMINQGFPDPDLEEVAEYLRDERYVAVAAVHKFARQHHVYFVDRRSPLFGEIARRLTTVEGLTYREPSALVSELMPSPPESP